MTNHLAYIDPGSGSLLFQLLIAGILGTFFFFKNTFKKISGFVKTKSDRLSFSPTTGIAHPFLIILFYVLLKTKEVIILYSAFTLISTIIALFIAIGILLIVLKIITKNVVKSALFLSVFLLPFLFYDLIYQSINSILFIQNNFGHIGFIVLLSFLITATIILLSKNNYIKLNAYFNILFSILLLIEGGIATNNYFKNHSNEDFLKKQEFTTTHVARSETPVIYHILLDAYTSSNSLKKYWNYDNSELENFLESNGFFIAKKAISNTTSTHQSMASTFNMDYQFNLDSILNNELLSTSQHRNLINYSRWTNELTNRNYKIYNFSIFDIGGSSKYFRSGLLPDATSLYQLLSDGTRLATIGKQIPYSDFKNNLEVFRNIGNLPAYIENNKTFIYAHINMPHDAYCDRNGNAFTGNQNNRKSNYLESLIYTNTLLIETIRKILINSKTPPVILIHGDHGSRMQDDAEKNTVFSAYYFPDKDYRLLYDSISLVNSYRVICKKYFKEDFNLLPDRKGFKVLQ